MKSHHLAATPMGPPRYAVPVKLQSGETVQAGDPRMTRALVSLMDMTAVMGGAASHYGGPAAFAELMSAVHALMFSIALKQNRPWHELFNFVNDAGHCENGIYALRANYGFADLSIETLKGFRSITSKLTGHGESHLFPESVLLSNGPLGSAFPQSQGLAMADAHGKNARVTITAISDGACMEGEAREALASLPGLAKRGLVAPFVLVISDNNTKLSGRIDQESFSMQPTFASLSALGWKVVHLEDGHDLQKCVSVLETALMDVQKNPLQPIAIHAKTIKGIGTRKTAESSSGGHGFPLKSPTELGEFLGEILEGQVLPVDLQKWVGELIHQESESKAKKAAAATSQPAKAAVTADDKIQLGVGLAMIKARKSGMPIVSLTSDLPGSTGVAAFRKEFPADSFDLGVAESNMISAAAGFSKQGYIAVVDTFAQFGVSKGALPLTMASLSEAPVICIFSHTGFQDAADGASHQALSYVAMVASIPNVSCYLLTAAEEAEQLVSQAIEEMARWQKGQGRARSFVFFLGRENFPKKISESPAVLDEMQVMRASMDLVNGSNEVPKSVTIVASGSVLGAGLRASQILESREIQSIVINPQSTTPKNMQILSRALQRTQGRLILVEDHQRKFGLNQFLLSELALQGLRLHAVSLGVEGVFGQSAYNAKDLYHKHGLDAEAIVSKVMEMF